MRFFTFGCSFTRYHRWPTWADILAQQFDHYQNWGLQGTGNTYILNSIIEAHQRNTFTKDDSVYVMWTSTGREDRYLRDHWTTLGSIYWQDMLPKEYIKSWTCDRGYIIRDLANITVAKHMLDAIGCRYEFMSMVPLDKTSYENGLGYNPNNSKDDNQDVFDLYQSTLDSIHPSVYETVFNNDWNRPNGIFNAQDNQMDLHPTPKEHLMYLNQTLPDLIKNETWALEWDTSVREGNTSWKESNRPIRL